MWLIYGCSGNRCVYINFNFLSFVCSLYHLSKTKFSLWILVLNQLSADGGTGELTSPGFSMWPWQCASASVRAHRNSRAPAETPECFHQSRPVPTGRGNFGPVSPGIWPKTFLLSWHGPYLLYHNSFSLFGFPVKWMQLVNGVNVAVDFIHPHVSYMPSDFGVKALCHLLW